MRYESARLAGFSAVTEKKRCGFDTSFFVLVVLLLTMGVVMVLSSSYARAYYDPGNITGGNAAYYFVRQLLFALLGVGAMLFASRLPMGLYRRYAFVFLGAVLVLLLLVPVIGVKANGARRWLGVGGLTVQPSELAKLAVILSFSALICRLRGRMATFRYGILPFAGILLVIIALLVLEPHFSASVIIIAIGGAMLFLGGVRIGWFAAAFGAVGAGVAVLLMFFPYASSRINTWRDPFSSSSDEGYQIVQSLYSIGSGGLTGKGMFSLGSFASLGFIPDDHTDFCFAIVCEAFGFIGATALILAFALLLGRLIWHAVKTEDKFGSYIITGVMAMFLFHIMENICMIIGLMPVTGIPLPFISYGGSNYLTNMLAIGLVMNVVMNSRLNRQLGDNRYTQRL